MELHQVRHLGVADAAPVPPKVDQHDLSLQIRELDGLPVFPALDAAQLWRALPRKHGGGMGLYIELEIEVALARFDLHVPPRRVGTTGRCVALRGDAVRAGR